MKKILAFIFCVITLACPVSADTVNINWIVDNETYTTTTCNIGDDLILPTAPTKYGYTFQGWTSYTPLEYIQFTGTQYIDTGIVIPNYDWHMEFTLAVLSQWGRYLIGAGPAGFGGGNGYELGIAGQSGLSSWGSGTANTTASGLDVSLNTFYDFKIDKYGFYVNETLKVAIAAPRDAQGATNNVYIGRISSSDTSYDRQKANTKWKRVTIYDDSNTAVFDGVPAKDPYGEPCMYDKVSGNFFYNAGTGSIVAGPVKNQ